MMRPNTPDWSDAQKAALTKLWGEGATARQIGLAIGRSRAAVCGMARRLNLQARQVQVHAPTKSKAQIHATSGHRVHRGMGMMGLTLPVAPSHGYAKGAAWEALEGPPPVSLVDLEPGMCKWPIGEGKPFLFCGHPATNGSYCEHHHNWSVGNGSSMERAAIKFAVDANKEEWRRGEAAKMRRWEPENA